MLTMWGRRPAWIILARRMVGVGYRIRHEGNNLSDGGVELLACADVVVDERGLFRVGDVDVRIDVVDPLRRLVEGRENLSQECTLTNGESLCPLVGVQFSDARKHVDVIDDMGPGVLGDHLLQGLIVHDVVYNTCWSEHVRWAHAASEKEMRAAHL